MVSYQYNPPRHCFWQFWCAKDELLLLSLSSWPLISTVLTVIATFSSSFSQSLSHTFYIEVDVLLWHNNTQVPLPMTCVMIMLALTTTVWKSFKKLNWGSRWPLTHWQIMLDKWLHILISEQPPPPRAWDLDPDFLFGPSGMMQRSVRRNGTQVKELKMERVTRATIP